MELTISIITKNRKYDLENCLKSIYCQKYNDFYILIVDNDYNMTAWPVYKNFSMQNKIKISYVYEPETGYSNARNCALKKCETRYLAFVDDDCILDRLWTEQGIGAIIKYKSAYVVGHSIQDNNNSTFSEVERAIFHSWMPNFYDKNTKEINPERIDTKNIILDIFLLKTNNICFDKRFNKYGGEDTDLGFQIKQCNFKGYFIETMILYHKGKLSLQAFIKKSFAYGYNGCNLYNKWKPKNECSNWPSPFRTTVKISLKKIIDDFKNTKQDTIIKKIIHFFVNKLFHLFLLIGSAKMKKFLKKESKKSIY